MQRGVITIAVVGEFSSGKSSLINALIGHQLLPVADRPLTSIRVEIRHSSQNSLTVHWSNPASPRTQKRILEILRGLEPRGFSFYAPDLGNRIHWNSDATVCSYATDNPEAMARFLSITEKSRRPTRSTPTSNEKTFSQRVKSLLQHLRNTIVTVIHGIVNLLPISWRNPSRRLLIESIRKTYMLGASRRETHLLQAKDIDQIDIEARLPEFWENVCLIDLPGAGSLQSYSPNTKMALETSQFVFHVLDAEHIGSKVTEDIIRTSVSTGRTIYFLNKKDNVDSSSLEECIAFLKEKYNVDAFAVSALYENVAITG